MKVNVEGSICALNIARENKCQIFIPSTIAAYGGDKFQKHMAPVESIM